MRFNNKQNLSFFNLSKWCISRSSNRAARSQIELLGVFHVSKIHQIFKDGIEFPFVSKTSRPFLQVTYNSTLMLCCVFPGLNHKRWVLNDQRPQKFCQLML